MHENEGRGIRPGAPNSEEAPKSQSKPNQPEQSAHGGGIKTPEHQVVPGVWDILERHVRLNAKDVEDHPRGKEHDRQQHEVNWLIYDLKTKKGTNREKLIIELFNSITIQPGEYGPTDRDLSLEEFQQFRSELDGFSTRELAEEITRQRWGVDLRTKIVADSWIDERERKKRGPRNS